MALIRRTDIDEVRARIDVADVVGEYVTLKGAGVGSLKGLCPFHDERSPSFHVRRQAGFYHCFGCGEGGDVFTFLQKMDHISFTEAVERLAGRLGYELHYEDGGAARSDHGKRTRLLAANHAASEFFVAQLAEPAAELGRKFLGERGFDATSAAHFGIGFAPKSYDALSKHLLGQGFTGEEILAAGLVGQGERGTYDRFRGRLTWPIRDTTGQTLGFGARKLFDDDQGPKYLNTPDTPVFHKSKVLYGIDLARRDIARGKQVVVVEGYTDVMACHLAGVTTAVATCGTAFGADHITLIRRVLGDVDNADTTATGEVIFTFDPDDAGQKAATRAFADEQRFAAQTFVAVASEGLDPCDLRLERGDSAVRALVESRKPMFEFMIRRRLAEHDLETVEGRVAALRAAAPVVVGIRDRALHAGYVRNLAGWLGLDPTEVDRAVSAAKKTAAQKSASGPTREASVGRGLSGEAASGEGAEAGSDALSPADQPSMAQLPTDPVTRLERDAIMAILQQPEEVGRDLVVRATHVSLHNSTLSVVLDGIAASLDALGDSVWLERIRGEVPALFVRMVTELGVAPLPEKAGRELTAYCRAITGSLIEKDLLAKKRELLGSLQRTDPATDPERYRQIQRELMAVEGERRSFRPE